MKLIIMVRELAARGPASGAGGLVLEPLLVGLLPPGVRGSGSATARSFVLLPSRLLRLMLNGWFQLEHCSPQASGVLLGDATLVFDSKNG